MSTSAHGAQMAPSANRGELLPRGAAAPGETPGTDAAPREHAGAKTRRRWWWSVGGVLLGLAALVWIAVLIDLDRLQITLRNADPRYLLLLPLAIAAEQLVRAWKWRQLLHPLRAVPTPRLFGAIMAGYLANLLVPLGVSPFIRSWLVARRAELGMSAVLATVAVDRLIDGVVFAGFVALVLLFAAFPDPTGGIRAGLTLGGAGGFALFALLLGALAYHKRRLRELAGWMLWLVERLPARGAARARGLLASFADGIVWPPATARRLGVILAGIVIKVIAATHFLWAGLAFGIVLRPIDYLFLLAFAGFAHILAHTARVPGGFIVGAIFALGLLGVGEEEAVAMVAAVQLASMTSVAALGALALWRNGLALGDLRARGAGRVPGG